MLEAMFELTSSKELRPARLEHPMRHFISFDDALIYYFKTAREFFACFRISVIY